MTQNNLKGMFDEITNFLMIAMFRVISNMILCKTSNFKLEKSDDSWVSLVVNFVLFGFWTAKFFDAIRTINPQSCSFHLCTHITGMNDEYGMVVRG